MMSVGVWPGVLMTVISSAWKAKSGVTRDVTDGLYSKTAYAVAKGLLNLVSSGGVFLAYAVPGYLLAGLHYPQQDDDLDVFYFYIGKNSAGFFLTSLGRQGEGKSSRILSFFLEF